MEHDRFENIKFIFHLFSAVTRTSFFASSCIVLCLLPCLVIYGTLLLESFDVIDSLGQEDEQSFARAHQVHTYKHTVSDFTVQEEPRNKWLAINMLKCFIYRWKTKIWEIFYGIGWASFVIQKCGAASVGGSFKKKDVISTIVV